MSFGRFAARRRSGAASRGHDAASAPHAVPSAEAAPDRASNSRWLAFLGGSDLRTPTREPSPGAPLDASTRTFMEPRFGSDLGRVRVRTDAAAADSARALNARAFTVGQDIAFAAGEYAPHTEQGRELLAHELAHTVQQRVPGAAPPSFRPDGPAETSADSAASRVARGEPVGTSLPACGEGVSRAPDPAGSPDKALIAQQLEEVRTRLKQAEYPDRERDLAIEQALMMLLDDEDEESGEAAPAVRGPSQQDILRPRDPRVEYGERMIKQFNDEIDGQRRSEAEASAEKEQEIAEEAELQLETLLEVAGGPALSQHQMATVINEKLGPRARAILRHYGLKWPRRGPTHRAVQEALGRWRARNTGGGPVLSDGEAAWKRQEQDEILAVQMSGYAATTGSLLGAIAGGVTRLFTDNEKVIAGVANMGAAAESFLPLAAGRGSYVPEVENEPFDPYGPWRYSGPARTVEGPVREPVAREPSQRPVPAPAAEPELIPLRPPAPSEPTTTQAPAQEPVPAASPPAQPKRPTSEPTQAPAEEPVPAASPPTPTPTQAPAEEPVPATSPPTTTPAPAEEPASAASSPPAKRKPPASPRKPSKARKPAKPAKPANDKYEQNLDRRLAKLRNELMEAEQATVEYQDARTAVGENLKGGPSKRIWNKKEEIFVLERAKAHPERQILEQPKFVGVKLKDGSIKTTAEIAGEGRTLDFVELEGTTVRGGEVKSKAELVNSVEDLREPSMEGGFKPTGSKVGVQRSKEQSAIDVAVQQGGLLVLEGKDVRTGATVHIEVSPESYRSTVVSYDQIVPN